MLYKAFLRFISNILLVRMHFSKHFSSGIVLIKYEYLGKVLLFCVLDTFWSTVI